ncbi:Ldh family oxidoreductase [Haloarculaceae archaeon H-GB11]|nr:Ldh family oxidoreductase [Haloarculaceae archaeon H-GB11]
MSEVETVYRVDSDALVVFASDLVEPLGLPPESARDVAESLVAADLRGHGSHGVTRVPYYRDLIAEGNLDPTGTPTVTAEDESIHVDGGRTFGQLVGRVAVEEGIEERPSSACRSSAFGTAATSVASASG